MQEPPLPGKYFGVASVMRRHVSCGVRFDRHVLYQFGGGVAAAVVHPDEIETLARKYRPGRRQSGGCVRPGFPVVLTAFGTKGFPGGVLDLWHGQCCSLVRVRVY